MKRVNDISITVPFMDKFLIVFLILIIGIFLGYGWRLHHEGRIVEQQDTQAQRDLFNLENEFQVAWEKPRSFSIFQGQFKVWPVKNDKGERMFSYAGAGDQHNKGKR